MMYQLLEDRQCTVRETYRQRQRQLKKKSFRGPFLSKETSVESFRNI